MQEMNTSSQYAIDRDDADILFANRIRFHFPMHDGHKSVYLCGNSLGLQPRSVSYLMQRELDDWATFGVEGHFRAKNPWLSYHQLFSKSLARIVGAKEEEVVATNTLTVNLHLLMLSFYRPKGKRTKIIMEAGAFPSDQYAIETQAQLWGLNVAENVIEISPRKGEHCLREEDILNTITETGEELAVVMMGGVNYYTGQLFPLEKIVKATHAAGAICGLDLAHAVGNVKLELHEWNVDFACWCSYKYLNSGPGGVGGLYVHERHGNDKGTFRLAGWWGNDESTRFKMKKGFVPADGAASWQMSNAPVFNMVGLRASLDIFDNTTMDELRKKSEELTEYLYFLLEDLDNLDFTIITPKEKDQRGAQLSLLFNKDGKKVFEKLEEAGVIADWREPNVIRIAPVPMYNSFEDVHDFYSILKGIVLSNPA